MHVQASAGAPVLVAGHAADVHQAWRVGGRPETGGGGGGGAIPCLHAITMHN